MAVSSKMVIRAADIVGEMVGRSKKRMTKFRPFFRVRQVCFSPSSFSSVRTTTAATASHIASVYYHTINLLQRLKRTFSDKFQGAIVLVRGEGNKLSNVGTLGGFMDGNKLRDGMLLDQ